MGPPPGATCREIRALAVITEFADTTFEAYSGNGFTSTGALRDQLDAMESHWAWASLHTHALTWDVVRVKLDQPLVPGAYGSWWDFREAGLQKALEKVDPARYDADSDGKLDVVWHVIADGGASMTYVIGGASGHAAGCVFQDSQASGSAQDRATGNFNHEAGHCLGLPDLYGANGTLHFLTFMADSWALPPNGLTAYERHLLGWFTPTEITGSRIGIELAPAETSFEAVRIPTRLDREFFLVEYRSRPEFGYGSTGELHDGLAIYHVMEGSEQATDPPLVKLEPADGAIDPGEKPTASDFWSPENADMHPSFTGRSYVDGEDIFRLGNVARTPRGLRFDLVVLPSAREARD